MTTRDSGAGSRGITEQRLLSWVGLIFLAVPVAAYFWLIYHYGANGIWYDQWDDVRVISHPTLSALWAQHNEGRLFFPNLVVLGLVRTTHFNIHAEAYLGGVMLVAAVGLFVMSHRRRAGVGWLFYVPFVLVMLSFVQAQNSLWGFQMAWYLVMLALAVALFLLDRPILTSWAVGGGIVAAVIGSYSSLQGLLIWPIGLLVLYCRSRSGRAIGIWCGAALLTAVVFFYHYSQSAGGGDRTYGFVHPWAGIQFFFVLIGETVGQQFPYLGHSNAVLALGVVIAALAVWTLCAYGFRRTDTAAPVGVALIVFGLLFAALTTTGRVSFTLWAATGSRYTTFDLLIPAGCYLVLLERVPSWSGRRVAQSVSIGTIVLLMVLGTRNGLTQAREWHGLLSQAAKVTAHIEREPNSVVESALSPGDAADIAYIRQEAKFAESDHLGVFGG